MEQVIEKVSDEDIAKNRLRLKTSIDAAMWLAFQACPFQGNDEGPNSKNKENIQEMVKLLASYNEHVNAVVLDNAPGNAKYTSPDIQKEILHTVATNIQISIRKEIGNAKTRLIVDEARDESKREQMALVVRFVDTDGFIRERFFDLVHVPDTTAATLKESLCSVLFDQCLCSRKLSRFHFVRSMKFKFLT